MPASLYLQQFGEHVFRSFGHVCYHVGSSLTDKRGWRDVDVRLILPDEDYERMKFGDPVYPQQNKAWVSTVLAWSAFGQSLTGLPVDFQIQQQTWFLNSAEVKKRRSALITLCEIETRAELANLRYKAEDWPDDIREWTVKWLALLEQAVPPRENCHHALTCIKDEETGAGDKLGLILTMQGDPKMYTFYIEPGDLARPIDELVAELYAKRPAPAGP